MTEVWSANTFLAHKQLPNLLFLKFKDRFLVFLTFPVSLASSSLRRVGCNNWRLHWGIDVIGAIEPKTLNGHRFILVAIDYFTKCIPFTTRLGFDCTNNMVEYKACALGIQAVIDFKVKLTKVYGDSVLVIHQLRGEWRIIDHKFIPYQAYIKKFIEFFDDVSFHHIHREENQMVDALATLTSMFQLIPHGDLSYIEFRCHDKSAHCYLMEEEQDDRPWYFDIKLYIEDKEYSRETIKEDWTPMIRK